MIDHLQIQALLLLAFAACLPGCKMDLFLFDADPADLEDYDFTSTDLDGIPPERITSELIPSQQEGKDIHVIYVERDVNELDPRIDPDAGVSIVFSHGNRGNLLGYWYRAGYFEDMGFNVLFYDYRGYGASDGTVTEKHIYGDVETAYDYLAGKPGVGQILSVGYSMGGGPAIWLCSKESGRTVLGCFTESAFASTEKLIHDGTGYDFVGSWFMDAEFDNESRIAGVTVPFLMMHGRQDQRVAYENGEILWDAVENNHPLNRFFTVEAGHPNVPLPSYKGSEEPRKYSHPDELPADLRDDFERYKTRIVNFVVDVLGEPVAPEKQLY